jgi:hypothetical protein
MLLPSLHNQESGLRLSCGSPGLHLACFWMWRLCQMIIHLLRYPLRGSQCLIWGRVCSHRGSACFCQTTLNGLSCPKRRPLWPPLFPWCLALRSRQAPKTSRLPPALGSQLLGGRFQQMIRHQLPAVVHHREPVSQPALVTMGLRVKDIVWKIFCLLFRGTHNRVRNFRVRAQPLICQLVCLGLSRNFFQ